MTDTERKKGMEMMCSRKCFQLKQHVNSQKFTNENLFSMYKQASMKNCKQGDERKMLFFAI